MAFDAGAFAAKLKRKYRVRADIRVSVRSCLMKEALEDLPYYRFYGIEPHSARTVVEIKFDRNEGPRMVSYKLTVFDPRDSDDPFVLLVEVTATHRDTDSPYVQRRTAGFPYCWSSVGSKALHATIDTVIQKYG